MEKDNNIKDQGLKRRYLLIKFIQKSLKDSFIIVSIEELYKVIKINDYDVLKITLDKLEKELQADFRYKTNQFVVYYNGKNYARSNLGIKIIVDDDKKLNKYLEKIEKKLNEKEDEKYKFILDDESKLFLQNSDIPPYKMEKGALRLKLLTYLAKEKKFIQTKDLATLFKVTEIIIRKTVNEIRTEVEIKLKVPKKSIIKNSPSVGYKVDNVKLP
jgi:hypothetical protein